MACFMGYIELFDSIEFHSKGKWDNNVNVLKDKELDDGNSQNDKKNELLLKKETNKVNLADKIDEQFDFSSEFKQMKPSTAKNLKQKPLFHKSMSQDFRKKSNNVED